MTEPSPIQKTRAYSLFAFAAMIYTAGVVAFSVWSYDQHRNLLLAHIDQSLINATHATEQILGDIYIQCAVETESLHELGYAANKKELSQFATACDLDAVGAIAIKGTNLWPLVGGIEHDGIIPSREVLFKDPIQSQKLAEILHTIKDPSSQNYKIQNLEHEKYGLLRLAVRYEGISKDSGYALISMLNIDYINDIMRAQLIQSMVTGLFLLLMAFPLAALFHRAKLRTSRQMDELNALLRKDVEQRKARETELEDAIHDLERFNAVTVGRESRIIELKAEVNTLLEQMDRKKRYNVTHVE
jgi:hypothetical protein